MDATTPAAASESLRRAQEELDRKFDQIAKEYAGHPRQEVLNMAGSARQRRTGRQPDPTQQVRRWRQLASAAGAEPVLPVLRIAPRTRHAGLLPMGNP